MAESFVAARKKPSRVLLWDGTASTIGGTTFKFDQDVNQFDLIEFVMVSHSVTVKPKGPHIMIPWLNADSKARVYFVSCFLTWTDTSVTGSFGGRIFVNIPTASGNLTGGASTATWPVYKIYGIRRT